ncbi:hypothetical protein HBO34_30715 [Pseudomonas veronii]|uniref:Uncharacterized protein n=1 Tax=Pseudomonas veronii TaxID=76761 RepID=A0A7Y1AD73_PSEVE|nr:hypothetical protein [Pseudomonas veronii]NMX42223.1 hypothetical protein [Pseudomonas veronii]NMX53988.1 hypothetical protein [Pseudomonas veronii]NMY13607.1 hypothetical protein [Pseudomonas veronii]NWD56520.1 hypothetical protein [Pseudomonas veronii]
MIVLLQQVVCPGLQFAQTGLLNAQALPEFSQFVFQAMLGFGEQWNSKRT